MNYLIKILTLGFVVFSIFSCGGNKQNQTVDTNVYQNCNNCGIIQGQTFYRSTSVSVNNNIILNLNFAGQQNFANFTNYLGSPVVSYNGLAAATGALRVNVMANILGCIVPAGDYSVQTIQAGQWFSGGVSQLRLTAIGPTQMTLMITTAQVSAKKQTNSGLLWTEIPQEGSLFANVMFETVGGYACHRSELLQ